MRNRRHLLKFRTCETSTIESLPFILVYLVQLAIRVFDIARSRSRNTECGFSSNFLNTYALSRTNAECIVFLPEILVPLDMSVRGAGEDRVRTRDSLQLQAQLGLTGEHSLAHVQFRTSASPSAYSANSSLVDCFVRRSWWLIAIAQSSS